MNNQVEKEHGQENNHGHEHGKGQDHGHEHGGGKDHGHEHKGGKDHGHDHKQGQDHGHEHGGGNDHGHEHGGGKDHGHEHGGNNDESHSHGGNKKYHYNENKQDELEETLLPKEIDSYPNTIIKNKNLQHSHVDWEMGTIIDGQLKNRKKTGEEGIKKILLVTFICLMFMFVEIAGGVIANSLAILTDAAHLSADVVGFLISVIAILLSRKKGSDKFSYGWGRSRIVGAMVSIILIWGLTAWLIYEAVLRVITPVPIDAVFMLGTSIFGLVCNLVMVGVFYRQPGSHTHGGLRHAHGQQKDSDKNDNDDGGDHGHSHGGPGGHEAHGSGGHEAHGSGGHEAHGSGGHGHAHGSGGHQAHGGGEHGDHGQNDVDAEIAMYAKKAQNINVRAAYIHTVGDMIQSVGVVLAASLIYYNPEWHVADPICTFTFSIVVFCTTIGIIKDCIMIIMEATPKGINYKMLMKHIQENKGVEDVYDLHVWNISEQTVAMTCHIASRTPKHTVKAVMRIAKSHGINHPTIQIYDPSDPTTNEDQ